MTRPNLATIMRRAHQIAKTECEGDYRACLALGMRAAWAEAKGAEKIMSNTIYNDGSLVLTIGDNGSLSSERDGKAHPVSVSLYGASVTDALPAGVAAALKGQGKAPADHYTVCYLGSPRMVLPNATRAAVEQAIAAKAAEKATIDAASAERIAKERAYDNAHNEGAYGYNPHRQGDRPTYWKQSRGGNAPYHKGDNYAE